ncbi:MAG: PKD domain-containing protein [Bacteroidales bacterium]
MKEFGNIEELVRSKLEGGELTPSPGSFEKIRRTWQWKRFLTFRPGGFNVYYAGLLVVGATLVVGTRLGSWVGSDDVTDPRPRELGTDGPLPDPGDRIHVVEAEAAGSEPGPGAGRERPGGSPDGDSLAAGQVLSTDSLAHLSHRVDSKPATQNMTVSEVLAPAPGSAFHASAQSGCAPLPVAFTGTDEGASAYRWDFGDGVSGEGAYVEHVYGKPGTYLVRMTLVHAKGGETVQTRAIDVHAGPQADFQIDPSLSDQDGFARLHLINYSREADRCSWSLEDEDGNPCGTWQQEGNSPVLRLRDLHPDATRVRLIATNVLGCSDTIQQEIGVEIGSSDQRVKYPNAFSPNPTGPGDGLYRPNQVRSDLFHPVFLEEPTDYWMRVYNRQGALVFETRDAYRGWDGYIQQQRAAAGVYVWMVQGRWADGTNFNDKGDLTLLWKEIW